MINKPQPQEVDIISLIHSCAGRQQEVVQPKYSGFDAISSSEGDPISVYALKQAYRKHALNDDSIGWDELHDTLGNALAQIMGDDEFVSWSDSAKPNIGEPT